MRPHSSLVFLITGLAALSIATGAGAPVVIDRATAICVGADEPQAVASAAEDLAADFAKVFGQKARIVHRREDAGPTAVVIASSTGEPESFTLSARERDVVLAGPDARGRIYAIYDFAER